MTNTQYTEAVNSFSDCLFRIAFSYCKNRQDAEDAVQDAFLKLYTCSKTFESDEHLKNYLIKIAVNNCKHLHISPWKKRIELVEQQKEDSYQMENVEDKMVVYSAVMGLPDKYRIVTHLYYYEDYSVKQIAQLISEKETTVQTRLMRARQRLKDELKEIWQNEN